jgi:hypothetical protein
MPRTGPDKLSGFIISRRLLSTLDKRHIFNAEATVHALRQRGADFRLARGIYVYSPGLEAPPSELDLSREGAEFARNFNLTRRIAIVMPWPHQFGMNTVLDQIAESFAASSDLVTLFSPQPNSDNLIPESHRYLLRRYQSPMEFAQQFAAHHEAFPFHAILASGLGEGADIALTAKRRHGIPVTIRLAEVSTAEMEQRMTMMRDANRLIAVDSSTAKLLALFAPSMDVRIVNESQSNFGTLYRSLLVGIGVDD